MRVLIVSDTHRKHENLKEVLERVSPVQLLIHLGDAEGYEDYIGELCGCPFEIVSGNNDFFTSLPREREFYIGKYHVWLTHGHNYYVSMGDSDGEIPQELQDLEREAFLQIIAGEKPLDYFDT